MEAIQQLVAEIQGLREEVKAMQYMAAMPASMSQGEAARIMRVHVNTVQNMLTDGRLQRAGDGGQVATAAVWQWVSGKGIASLDFKRRMDEILEL
jgi:hypothetical protein